MNVIICRDHGNVKLSFKQFKEQLDKVDGWRCPICHKFGRFTQIPDGSLNLGCVMCKSPVTLKSIWDERNWGWFCNPFCVMDYDEAVKQSFPHFARGATAPKEKRENVT